ncbi:MAG: DNA polymerase III subunit delta [Spirochaetaceae bacterium]|jgi:DNA polymerase-3 subunit delta|nr:DNA polymerase III subunit delta [Spirochaetaceae bacterium]
MNKGESFLFLGPEIGEKNDAIQAIREKLKKENKNIEESSFYIGETPLPEILALLLNGSLFSDTKLVFVKNIELVKKKQDVENLASYIGNPQEGTTLILVSDSIKVESGIEKCFQKNTKRIFWELFEEDKERWIFNFFRKAGFKIEGDAVSAILGMVENNTGALRQECERLVLFLKKEGQNPEITEDMILSVLAHSKQDNVFALFSALANGDVIKSFDILHSLIASGEAPQAIFGALAMSFRKFRDYCFLSVNNSLNDFELKKIGVSSRGKKDCAAARRIYGDAADRCLSLVAEFDILTRAHFILADVLMDLFVYKILSLKGNLGKGSK